MQAPRSQGLTSGVAVLAVTSCVGVDGAGDRLVIADSAGIVVVHNASPRTETPLVVSRTPIATVDPDFGAPDYLLYIADRAAFLDDGRFVVGSRGTNELFFFSASGDFEGVLGGEGDGPGEFQRVRDVYRCADDRLVVEEVSRVSFLDGGSMTFDETLPIEGHLAESTAAIGGVRQDCGAALLEGAPGSFPPRQPGVFEFPVTLYWADFAGGTQDTVGVFTNVEVAYIADWSLPLPAPYGRIGVRAVSGDEVVVGTGDRFEYRMFDTDGDLLRIVRWVGPSRVLSDEDWAYFEESRAERLDEDPQRARFEPPLGSYPRPSTKPTYAGMKVDDVSRIWIQAYGRYGAEGPEPAPSWSVFSQAGEWLADVRTPDGLEVLAVGSDRLVGVIRDRFGLERIQVYAFELSPANF